MTTETTLEEKIQTYTQAITEINNITLIEYEDNNITLDDVELYESIDAYYLKQELYSELGRLYYQQNNNTTNEE